jgi:GT2 family glycosyltransferase
LQATQGEHRDQIAALGATLAERDQHIGDIHRSRSWRITAPLRAISTFLSAIVGRPAGRGGKSNSKNGNPPSSQTSAARSEDLHYAIERAIARKERLSVEGWAFHEQERIASVALLVDTRGTTEAFPLHYGRPRDDVGKNWPFENADRSGFLGSAPLPAAGEHAIAVQFGLEDGSSLRIPIEGGSAAHHSKWRKGARLLRRLNRRRIGMGLRCLLRGEFRYLRERIQALIETPEVSVPDLDLANSLRLFHTSEPDVPAMEQEVDIIVPVYNGMEFLPRLFDSISRNTTSPYHLIIVDDCSTDPGVAPLLARVASERPNTVLLRNEENMGFVGSVNLAHRYVGNHFILLNTDIEVPRYWLERLMAPILEDPSVASATPFSNAATVCSFPHANQDNDIFAGLGVDEIDRAFRRVNRKAVEIELPSGVGFCMAMNRSVVNEIGGFDEKTFGRGYGEENDWSMRASAAGYRNVMVPNLFVYHKHGASFGHQAKKALMEENLKKVQRLHPTYQKRVDDFLRRDPPAPLRRFLVVLLASRYAAEKPILVVDHEMGGGANSYRRRWMETRLGRGQAILLLTYDCTWLSLKLQCFYQDYVATFILPEAGTLETLFDHIPLGEIFYNNLVGFERPLDILDVLGEIKRATGARLTVAIHDYFPLCPSFNLLNDHGRFCELPDLTECRRCLPANAHAEVTGVHDIPAWRERWGTLASRADKVLCFSRSSLDLVDRVFPLRAEQAVVRPHTLQGEAAPPPRIDFDRGLNIGVVGAINFAKGSEIVIQMARLMLERNLPARITVIGVLNNAPDVENLTVAGPYKPAELSAQLERYNVNLCFLSSIWPETFSYVTAELMQLQMPVCCFDIGAPAERVGSYDHGMVISRIDPAVALDEILGFFDRLRTADRAARKDRAAQRTPECVSQDY